ncbi:hypothetical protein SAMN05421505_11465 [Sinosporangium album]|uniref:Uncharacterized protein n=1 Tax=Sinosporangium album TaxID=504805 RepID=A0A1G8BJL7_9ACTN|nr:hypothetical protein SAMN05421505_11465 [Sinosporangium album]
MTIQKTHSLETVGRVSLAAGGEAADGADMRRTQESVDGLSLDLLDALTLLAQDRVRGGGLRLVRRRPRGSRPPRWGSNGPGPRTAHRRRPGIPPTR